MAEGKKGFFGRLVEGLTKTRDNIISGMDSISINEAGISLAFQQPVRFKGLTVRDLVTIAAGHDLTMDEACSYLSEVGLCAKDYIDRELNASLSGGEIKRIEIATILARGSKFSVFDEPEAGIDLWSFRSLIHVFEKMQRENDGTILIISHQERILNIADKIIYIKDGMVEKYGPREEVLPGLMHTSKAGCDVLMNKMED